MEFTQTYLSCVKLPFKVLELLKRPKVSDIILITGATGFVGSQLVKAIDNDYKLKLLSRTGENHFNYDIAKDTDYLSLLGDIDIVVFFLFRAVNVEGTINLAKQSAMAGVKRFIFVSSIKVNGESTTNKASYTADDIPAPEDP